MSTNYIHEISPDNGANVFQIKDAEAAPISLLEDTVGWVGKNKWNPTNMTGTDGVGITATKNSDGSVKLNGTATGDFFFPSTNGSIGYDYYDLEGGKTYIFSTQTVNSDIEIQVFCKTTSADSWTRLANDSTAGNDIRFTMPSSYYDVWIRLTVRNGKTLDNVTLYPMLRDASITDSTFEPPHKTVSDVITDVYSVMGENGAKNLVDAASSLNSDTASCIVTTSNGVITIDGTTSKAISFVDCKFTLPAGDYILSGCEGGSSSTYFIDIYESWDDWSSTRTLNYSGETAVTLTTNGPHRLRIYAASGIAFTNKSFYPMLRDARDTDSTYQPYAMTNKELTESVQGDSDTLTLSFSESSNVTLYIRKLIDNIVAISANAGSGYSNLPTSWVTVENFIPVKYRPSRSVYADMHIGPNAYLRFNILSDGTLKYLCTSSSTVYVQGTTMYVRS